jgi:hypothetical protein
MWKRCRSQANKRWGRIKIAKHRGPSTCLNPSSDRRGSVHAAVQGVQKQNGQAETLLTYLRTDVANPGICSMTCSGPARDERRWPEASHRVVAQLLVMPVSQFLIRSVDRRL